MTNFFAGYKRPRYAELNSTIHVFTKRFNNIITDFHDELVPFKEVTLRDCRRQQWFYDEAREARKKARRLYQRLKAGTNPSSKCEWRTTLKSSRRLAKSKKARYWTSEIHSASDNARHVWRTVANLLGESKSGAKPTFSQENYHSYINKKVVDVGAATSSVT